LNDIVYALQDRSNFYYSVNFLRTKKKNAELSRDFKCNFQSSED